MKWRFATKNFDPAKKISDSDWKALEETLILTPSSFGLQPWKFIIVTDPSIKKKLVAASWNQKQVEDCSHHVVFAIKKKTGIPDVERYIKRISEVQATEPAKLEKLKKMILGFLSQPPEKFNVDHWATLQVYIALGNFMTAAAVLGIDTCPMEGIVPSEYDKILELEPKGYATAVACAAGYRHPSDPYASAPKVRFQSDDVIERI